MTVAVIDQIAVGERGRTDLGDIAELAASIEAVGLLHPVVVTAANELVAGERRLEAVRRLGWTEVPITVVDLDSAADVLRAELEENTCRKALSAYEADVIRQKREAVLKPKAAENKGGRPTKDAEKTSSNLDEVSEPATARATRKAAAVGTGYSGTTLDKVRTIRDAAERGVVKQGKQEVPAPEPVREVAQQAVENVKQTGAAIDREFQRVTKAIDAYMEADVDVQRARRAKAWGDALRATQAFRSFDFASLATTLTPEDWDAEEPLIGSIERAVQQYKKVRPRGLRVV